VVGSVLDKAQCPVVIWWWPDLWLRHVKSVLDMFRAVTVVVEGCLECVKFSLEALLLADDFGHVW
jgi:hypothetical protein